MRGNNNRDDAEMEHNSSSKNDRLRRANRKRKEEYRDDYASALRRHLEQNNSFSSFATVVKVQSNTLYRWIRKHKEFREVAMEFARDKESMYSRGESISSKWFNKTACEQKVDELVKEGVPFKEARRMVYWRNGLAKSISAMPKDLPERLMQEKAKGWSRSVCFRNCGVAESTVYQWAKQNAELRAVLVQLQRAKKAPSTFIAQACMEVKDGI